MTVAERTWHGRLKELAERLHAEAWAARGRPVWWLLPRGLLVAAWVDRADMRKRLRFARDAVLSAETRGAFLAECLVARRELGASDWYVDGGSLPGPGQRAAVVLIEPRPNDELAGCERCMLPAPCRTPGQPGLCAQCSRDAARALEEAGLAGADRRE
jgi:hypothetical protein